jgi:tRNA A37 N6-isopentenylltransferase MiaA
MSKPSGVFAMMSRFREVTSTITQSAAVFGLLGVLFYSTGWVVSRAVARADAAEDAQQKANEVRAELLTVQQKIYDKLEDQDQARVKQDIEILALQIESLESKPDRSDYENVNLRILNQQLVLKQAELSKMLESTSEDAP